MKKVLMLLLVATISACASMARPTEAEIATLDYGAWMSQEDAESGAKGFLSTYLRDPYSAVIAYSPIYKGWVKEPALNGGAFHYGYVLDTVINAKNAMGGYVGAKAYKFIFRDGKLVAALEQRPGPYWWNVMKWGG